MIEKDGYSFCFNETACQFCPGRCCTGDSGYIWLEISDIEAIADLLDIEFSTAVRQYTRRINGRFSLKEIQRPQGDFACIFFKNGCDIYDVRPKQCRTYPFWTRFIRFPEEVIQECPGIIPKQEKSK